MGDPIKELRAYATRERSTARALADSALKTPKSATAEAKQKASETSAYYRSRQNTMDDILRKLGELAPAEVRQ